MHRKAAAYADGSPKPLVRTASEDASVWNRSASADHRSPRYSLSVWQTGDCPAPPCQVRDRSRVDGKFFALTTPEKNKSFAKLRNAEVSGIQHFPRLPNFVTVGSERSDQLFQEGLVLSDRQPLHVLEDKGPGIQLGDDANEFKHELVSGIVQRTMSDQRKPLTGRTAEDAIDWRVSDTGGFADRACAQTFNRMRNNGGRWEVVLVNRTMNRINFDRSGYVKTGPARSRG